MILEKIVQASTLRAQTLPYPGLQNPKNQSVFSDLSNRQVISLHDAIVRTHTKKREKNAIIAEIKPASPSRGHIRAITDPVAVAKELVKNGCCAISVITEPAFFQGNIATIQAIRGSVQVPILRKDFIVDLRQIKETRQIGADAVLLIAAVLKDRLSEFVDATMDQGLEPLVEVHTRQEVRSALDTSAVLIGVNNRNLKTLKTDISMTCRLSPLIREAGRKVIAESGVIWPCDIRTLRPYADGFLIGSSIMAAQDPGKRLEGFVSA
jgi:indole-3-glycerol phosphate synthase